MAHSSIVSLLFSRTTYPSQRSVMTTSTLSGVSSPASLSRMSHTVTRTKGTTTKKTVFAFIASIFTCCMIATFCHAEPMNERNRHLDGENNPSCEPGEYKVVEEIDEVKVTECFPCSPGTYSNADRTACILCPAGGYCPSPRDRFVKCDPGYYNNQSGQHERTACKDCPEGGYCPFPRDEFVECPRGYYNNQPRQHLSTACKDCPLGEYADKPSESIFTTKFCLEFIISFFTCTNPKPLLFLNRINFM